MSVGGAEKVLIDLLNNLDSKKYDITLIMFYKSDIYNVGNGIFKERFNENIKIKYLCDNEKNITYRLFNILLNRVNNKYLHKIFIGNKYDIEIAFYEGLPTKFIANSMNKKSKKIAWLHTDTSNRVKYLDEYILKEEKKNYSKYNEIIAVSETVSKSFIKVFDENYKVEVKYNPINLEQINLKSKELIEFDTKNRLNLCSVGRLTSVKGYDRLINVLGRLKIENFDFELWLIGTGEEYENLQRKVKELKLQKNIKFLGFQKNPYKYVVKCDLVICSSFAEGYSTSILEAIALGKPVLTTECSGMQEIFGDKECGIICNNSEEGLYIALKKIINNKKELLNYYSKESFKRSMEFNLENTIIEIQKIF